MNRLALVVLLLFAIATTVVKGLTDSLSMRVDTVRATQVVVYATPINAFTISSVDDLDGGAIYAGKKTEQVRMSAITANTSSNNARQVFSGIAGLNIWDNDGGGVQMGIGGRGLSPNRTSNFTTRQNGYDIAADPLGYPESYYTPPMDAVDRIQVVRGAGSLRYGSQFGGMVNFVMREPKKDSVFEGRVRSTYGSFNFAGLYAEGSGTVDNVGYIALYQLRRSDGWRPNSGFAVHTAYASVAASLTPSLRVRADYTFFTYQSQQPGGLTDRMFSDNPNQSVRSRNWFEVQWNLASLSVDYIISESTGIKSMFFGNYSSRDALGNQDRINMSDQGAERSLIAGTFRNIGNETTIQHTFEGIGTEISSVVAGMRLFHGTTTQQQGNASTGSGPDFTFLNPSNLEGSDFRYPNDNVAVFAESILRLGNGFAIVPGMRGELITTRSDGYYALRIEDFAGNVILDSAIRETRNRSRTFALFGIGLLYHSPDLWECYANASQNYRSITFSDLHISNPNLRIDPNIADERGYTLDAGIRGTFLDVVAYDASAFYLRYADRIGEVLRSDEAPLFLPYRYRTNVADAYTAGVEAVIEVNLTRLAAFGSSAPVVRVLLNGALTDGRYLDSDDASVRNRLVELVPPYVVRTGVSVETQGFRAAFVLAFIGKQYSDATNTEYSASAVTGAIPAYNVADLSASYVFERYRIEVSCNNLFDNRYFSRRADAYPGPGIIPAEARSFSVTLQASF